MLILLRFMETYGVALGYVGDKIRYFVIIRVRLTSEFFVEHGFIGLTRDASLGERVSPLYKIRYILIIRVRFTSEFFFEHGFIGLTRMFRSWRYCLPDSCHYMSWKSRDFVPGYSRFARYWLPAKSCWLFMIKYQ